MSCVWCEVRTFLEFMMRKPAQHENMKKLWILLYRISVHGSAAHQALTVDVYDKLAEECQKKFQRSSEITIPKS